jgi:stress-induced morphogen
VRERIQELLEGAFPQAEAVKVIDRTGGGDHFEVIVHDAAFNDLSRIEQHKLIYAALDEPWKQGNIHELRINTKGTEAA